MPKQPRGKKKSGAAKMPKARSSKKGKAWWDELLPHVGGDVIVGNVSGSAKNVAIGKNIQQTIESTLGPTTADDKRVVDQHLNELNAQVQKLRGDLDAQTASMAEFQIKLLAGELKKTGENETPSASTITQVGDWLLDNVPQVAETVVGLFATPAVGKVVGKAGEVAIKWAKQRFGNAAAAAG